MTCNSKAVNSLMASTVLAKISRPKISAPSDTHSASITDVKLLSSYNWIEAPTPTIAVPGSPPLWCAPSKPRQVNKDSGLIYIAQNAARHPDSPMEPLFRALYTTKPTFDIRSIDIVTDRNNLRKFLSFLNPSFNKHGLEAFTINVEITKSTAIFCRAETKTFEVIGQREFKGYGHEFEKAYTTELIDGSTGHHQIISYRFGDLNFIVRHETDGCVMDTSAKISPASDKKKGKPENDTLSDMLDSLTLSSSTSAPTGNPVGSIMTIRQEGEAIPRESTLEIKTRTSSKAIAFEEVAPQLWLSQTLNLVRAYHDRGRFPTVEVEDVVDAIREWERKNQADLARLVVLIKQLVTVVKDSGGCADVVFEAGSDMLLVKKVERKKMLPGDLYAKWDQGGDGEAAIEAGNDALSGSVAKPSETKAGTVAKQMETKAEEKKDKNDTIKVVK